MKKLINLLYIILLILCLNVRLLNVKAEGEETSGETGEVNGDEGGDETGSDDTPHEEDNKLKSDATLKSITIDGENIVCNDKLVCEYIVTDNETTSVKIKYTLTNEKASVDPKSGFTKELEDEVTQFNVKVTSEDKSKSNTYTFKITKKILSTDSTLSKLIINGTEIKLKDDVLKYQTTVSYSTKKLDVEVEPSDEKAVVVDFNNNKASFDFFTNTKEIKIKVKSESGIITTYVLTVSKRGEADTTLKSLTIKNYKLDFSSEVTDYELKVLKNVSKLEIDAKANDKNADVKITNPKLSVGENTVKIEVSNDGDTTTYTINVTKLNEDDKTLANLKSFKIEGYELDFKPDKYEYDLRIGDVNYLVIDAKPKLEDAEVEITGNLDLENGSIIKVKVNYEEEYQNVYKINIIKDGKAITKKNVSKKACIAVMSFDVLTMITIGTFQFINKNKNKKTNKEKDDSEIIDII